MNGTTGSPATTSPAALGAGGTLHAVAQFGESLLGIVSDMAKGLITPQVLDPRVALGLTGNPVERTTETLRLMMTGGNFVASAEELRNKGEIFTLVAAVSGLIGVPDQPPLPLRELVARSYALGPFYALWAIEGLGHDYGDSFWNQGVVPQHILSPETTAGAKDRAGFMEAPVTGPPKSASSPTVPPIAIAAASPTARESVATAMMTNIRKKVSTSSQRKAWPCEPLGMVAPSWAWSPREPRSKAAASSAPASCAPQ